MTPRDHSQSFDARGPRASIPRRAAVLLLAALAGATAASGQVLFPNPFVVEHKIVQTDPWGSVSELGAVTDYYHGSRIISVRPDESRLVVDFTERQLIEIRPDHQSYTVLSFDRFAELRERLSYLEEWGFMKPPENDEMAAKARGEEPEEPEFHFEELSAAAAAAKTASSELTARPGVRRLRVTLPEKSAGGDDQAAVEVWVDPSIRLGPAALTALERFQDEVLGARKAEGVAYSRYISAARKHARGAVPIRTVRPAAAEYDEGTVEDRALRLEPVTAVPQELVTVPEGYRRVVHPLELMVTHAEEQAALAMGLMQPEIED